MWLTDKQIIAVYFSELHDLPFYFFPYSVQPNTYFGLIYINWLKKCFPWLKIFMLHKIRSASFMSA